MPDDQTNSLPPYRLTGTRREADALAVHLSRQPGRVIQVEGFRITVEELHGIVSHAVANWPEEKTNG